MIFKQLRVYQWVKNILLFVPILLAHRANDVDSMYVVVASFFAFCFVASAVYIVNDIVDLKHDRAHPTKRFRPLASGRVSTRMVIVLIPVLLGFATTLCLVFLNESFVYWLVAYGVSSMLYAFLVKRIVIADVLLLSGLYVIRVAAGGAAASVEVSTWLLGFSMFLFTSLAFLKRFSELRDAVGDEADTLGGRGYNLGDAGFIGVAGPSVGYISILIFTLYLSSHEVQVLYKNATMLWLLVPCMLYWVSRLWLLAHRGKVHDDPILFTFTDPPSYVVGIIAVAIVVFASL